MFNLLFQSTKSSVRRGVIGTLHGQVKLFKSNEPLGARLASLNNLEFYDNLMKIINQKTKPIIK